MTVVVDSLMLSFWSSARSQWVTRLPVRYRKYFTEKHRCGLRLYSILAALVLVWRRVLLGTSGR
jgi:hypothetical protein